MKRLACEMCGSTDIMKQEGVFVCQVCGCKYSVEEAKKMMTEGVVDVTGSTIKVDNEDKVRNLRMLAKRAKEDNNSEAAAKYFEQILIEVPNDWEASFYTTYYAAHNIKIAQLGEAANRVINCFDSVIKLIKETLQDEDSQKAAYIEISTAIIKFKNMLVGNISGHLGGDLETAKTRMKEWFCPAIGMLVIFADRIITEFGDYELAAILYSNAKTDASKMSFTTDEVKKLDDIIGEKQKRNQEAIQQREKSLQEKRRKEYWEKHQEEKEKLEAEKCSLEAQIQYIKEDSYEQIKQISAESDTIDGRDEIAEIDVKIGQLSREKERFGILKFKEKKEIQKQIDNLNEAKKDLQTVVWSKEREIAERKSAAKQEAQIKIEPLRKRIGEINLEFSKER